MIDAPRKNNKRCAIQGCNFKPGIGTSLHTFPSDFKVQKAWVDACRISKRITRHDKICGRHFTSSDYKTAKSKYLWTFAIPSQHLPCSFVDVVDAESNSLDFQCDPLERCATSVPYQKLLHISIDEIDELLLEEQKMNKMKTETAPQNKNDSEKECSEIIADKKCMLLGNGRPIFSALFSAKNGVTVCRFCLTEDDTNEMIKITDHLAALYKKITNKDLFIASHCSAVCCLVCSNMIYQLSSAIELFEKADNFWRSQSVSVIDEI